MNSGVRKPWGTYVVMDQGSGYWVKMLVLTPSSETSLQSHVDRSETMICVAGEATIEVGKAKYTALPGRVIFIDKQQKHRVSTRAGCKLIELAIGRPDENDIVRYEDKYGRI
jgi:mannose-6-phosphate isomerase-like protein (cupin superfamily)